MDTTDLLAPAGRGRRQHSVEFKQRVVQACRQPGVSVAAVALSHGLNANLLRRWVVQHSAAPVLLAAPEPLAPSVASAHDDEGQFVPVQLEKDCAPAADIRIELRRGQSTASVSWPVRDAASCAAWLREWLR